MERLLESIYINARPAMEFKLSLTSSGRKKIVKIVDGDEVEMLPGDVQSILESQKWMLASSPISSSRRS